MKPSRFVVLLTLSIVAFAAPASAWPLLDVTSSEVLSIDPPRVKTTFTVVEQGSLSPGWCPWVWFDVMPQNPGTPGAPQFFSCEAPTEGQCLLNNYAGVQVVTFNPWHGDAGTLPANTYSIITDQVAPCVRFEFLCVILMGGVPPIETCLAVDMPVPAQPQSWGSLKAIYR